MTDVDWNFQLAEQLDWHWREQLRPRLDGLTDEEYRWEPVPGAWNVRPRGTGTAPVAVGGGEFTIDFAMPEPDPPPVTTIAWRLGHIVVGVLGDAGGLALRRPAVDYATHRYPGDAATALAQLDAAYAGWIGGVRGARRRRDWPGRSARPRARGPTVPWPSSCCTSTGRCCTTAPRSRCCATCTDGTSTAREPDRVLQDPGGHRRRRAGQLADFWALALDYVLEPPPHGFETWEDFGRSIGMPEEKFGDQAAVIDPADEGPRLFSSACPSARPPRTGSTSTSGWATARSGRGTQAADVGEVEQLVEAGASVAWVNEDVGGHSIVLRDPEGNEFCVA